MIDSLNTNPAASLPETDEEVVAAISLAIRLTLSRKVEERRITFSSNRGGDWSRPDRYFRNPSND